MESIGNVACWSERKIFITAIIVMKWQKIHQPGEQDAWAPVQPQVVTDHPLGQVTCSSVSFSWSLVSSLSVWSRLSTKGGRIMTCKTKWHAVLFGQHEFLKCPQCSPSLINNHLLTHLTSSLTPLWSLRSITFLPDPRICVLFLYESRVVLFCFVLFKKRLTKEHFQNSHH